MKLEGSYKLAVNKKVVWKALNNPEILNKIKSITESYKGNCRLIINIETSSGYMQKIVSQNINISPDIDLINQLRDTLGEKNIWIET